MQAYAFDTTCGAFAPAYARIAETVAWLADDQPGGMTHGEIESRLHTDGLAVSSGAAARPVRYGSPSTLSP